MRAGAVLLTAVTLLPATTIGRPAGARIPVRFDAMIEPFEEASVEEIAFPTFDAQGRKLKATRFRVVSGTGNDRENYLASTEAGMLLDFGGEWLRFSEDEGQTWFSVLPAPELRDWWSYEGAVATAPGGDVVAAGQDALVSGVFRALTFKYEAGVDKWIYSMAESSSPFLDRPAIGVLPGPFEIAGMTVPYVSVLRGGFFSTKSYWTYSLDGLNYDLANSRFADTATGLGSSGPLDVEPWAELDWIQPHELIGLAPYGPSKVLAERPSIGAFDTESHAPRSILDPSTFRWRAHEFPKDGPQQTTATECAETVSFSCLASEGRTLGDSKGNLHHVSLQKDRLVYLFSRDGGETWSSSETPLLDGYSVQKSNSELYKSVKVSGAENTSVVVVHAIKSQDPLTTKDLVYRFSFRGGHPKVNKIHVLGRGDFSCLVGGVSVSGGKPQASCDFPSITLLEGGRFAVSFTDATHREPAVAIELESRRRLPRLR